MIKTSLEKKEITSTHSSSINPSLSQSPSRPGRQRLGTEMDGDHGGMLLTTGLLQCATQVHLPRNGTTHSGPGNQENAP